MASHASWGTRTNFKACSQYQSDITLQQLANLIKSLDKSTNVKPCAVPNPNTNKNPKNPEIKNCRTATPPNLKNPETKNRCTATPPNPYGSVPHESPPSARARVARHARSRRPSSLAERCRTPRKMSQSGSTHSRSRRSSSSNHWRHRRQQRPRIGSHRNSSSRGMLSWRILILDNIAISRRVSRRCIRIVMHEGRSCAVLGQKSLMESGLKGRSFKARLTILRGTRSYLYIIYHILLFYFWPA